MSKENALEFIKKLNKDEALIMKLSKHKNFMALYDSDIAEAASEASSSPEKNEAFRDMMSNDENLIKSTLEAILTVAGEAGYSFTAAEFKQACEEKKSGELSDLDLEEVTGGLFGKLFEFGNDVIIKIVDTLYNIIGEDNMNKFAKFMIE